MALTITQIKTTGIAQSSTTYVTTSVNLTAGSWTVVCVAADNAGTGGSASLLDTLTDNLGNTYTLLSKTNMTSGVVNDGVTLGFWISKVDISGTASLTSRFSPSTFTKLVHIWRIQPAANKVVTLDRVGTPVSGNSTGISITATNVTLGQSVIANAAIRSSVAETFVDADTTNGSWSTGGATDDLTIQTLHEGGQYKTVTAPGDQTYNVSFSDGTSRNFVSNWITVYESDPLLGYWGMNQVTELFK